MRTDVLERTGRPLIVLTGRCHSSRSDRRPSLDPNGAAIDDYLRLLRPIAKAIVETFGSSCEVVIHDFRFPEHSIVAIEGNVTGRTIGGSMTEIGLSLIAQGDRAHDPLYHTMHTQSGRVLKSATILLHDSDNRAIGTFGINFDITNLRDVANAIEPLIAPASNPSAPITFTDNIWQIVTNTIQEEKIARGTSVGRMTKEDRLRIFRILDTRGIFELQRSVPYVASRLQISRATAYKYLEEIRSDTSTPATAGAARHAGSGEGVE